MLAISTGRKIQAWNSYLMQNGDPGLWIPCPQMVVSGDTWGYFFFEHLWVVLTFLTFQGIRQFIWEPSKAGFRKASNRCRYSNLILSTNTEHLPCANSTTGNKKKIPALLNWHSMAGIIENKWTQSMILYLRGERCYAEKYGQREKEEQKFCFVLFFYSKV